MECLGGPKKDCLMGFTRVISSLYLRGVCNKALLLTNWFSKAHFVRCGECVCIDWVLAPTVSTPGPGCRCLSDTTQKLQFPDEESLPRKPSNLSPRWFFSGLPSGTNQLGQDNAQGKLSTDAPSIEVKSMICDDGTSNKQLRPKPYSPCYQGYRHYQAKQSHSIHGPAICTYIEHTIQPNVGKHNIHGWYGNATIKVKSLSFMINEDYILTATWSEVSPKSGRNSWLPCLNISRTQVTSFFWRSTLQNKAFSIQNRGHLGARDI